jgi:hypothetical protein
MPPLAEPWRPEVNWDTPAGRVLDQLVTALPSTRSWKIIVFGSSRLQLGIDGNLLSGPVNVIPPTDIEEHCRQAKLLNGQAAIYIDLCAPAAFTASADWPVRACEVLRRHVTFVLPHPIDILVSKVKRLEEKDLRAFRIVLAKTGHPTEDELIRALRRVVDLYRPSFDEEGGNDPRHNTVTLWRELFEKVINVREQIIAPALEERRRNYGPQDNQLRDALKRVT